MLVCQSLRVAGVIRRLFRSELVERKEPIKAIIEGEFFFIRLGKHLGESVLQHLSVCKPDKFSHTARIHTLGDRNPHILGAKGAHKIGENLAHDELSHRRNGLGRQRIDLAINIVDVVLKLKQHIQRITHKVRIKFLGMEQDERPRPVYGLTNRRRFL